MAAQTATAAILGCHRVTATVRNEAYRGTARRGRPLLELQQRLRNNWGTVAPEQDAFLPENRVHPP